MSTACWPGQIKQGIKTAAHWSGAQPVAVAIPSKVFRYAYGSSDGVIFCTLTKGVDGWPGLPAPRPVAQSPPVGPSNNLVTASHSFRLAAF